MKARLEPRIVAARTQDRELAEHGALAGAETITPSSQGCIRYLTFDGQMAGGTSWMRRAPKPRIESEQLFERSRKVARTAWEPELSRLESSGKAVRPKRRR